MAYLAEYGLFFAKALTLFLLIVGILLSVVGVAMRHTPALLISKPGHGLVQFQFQFQFQFQ